MEEVLAKLSTLDGKKFLVLDDIKDVEDNQNTIDKILGLKYNGYKILITSREEIDSKEISSYYLDVLSLDDAKSLFNSIYKVEDEILLEEILGYLDYHAFFIEKTALSIKKTLTPKMIRDRFKNGEFSKISVKRKQNFNQFLNQLFRLDSLDSEEILMLKQLSTLPSIEIGYEDLENIFDKNGDSAFEELLDYLCEKGWLSKLEGSYKLHQIIKEYILVNHTPSFEEIESVLDRFNALIDNSADPQVAVDNQKNIIYLESLATILDRLNIENEKVGGFFAKFANIYRHLGIYQKAELLYLKALHIGENVRGKEELSIAIIYNNLAGLYMSMGEYQKAEILYLKALHIREKVQGEEELSLVVSYNNLAELYRSIGKYQKAEPFYLKALEIQRKAQEEKHPKTATIYNNLALLYFSMDKYQEAEPLYLYALKIWENVFGEEHTETAKGYNNLALLYCVQGEYQKAEILYLKDLNICEKQLGKKHPDTAKSYHNLGAFYYERGDYEKAYELMKKAVEVCSKTLPSNHPNLINAKEELEIIKSQME